MEHDQHWNELCNAPPAVEQKRESQAKQRHCDIQRIATEPVWACVHEIYAGLQWADVCASSVHRFSAP